MLWGGDWLFGRMESESLWSRDGEKTWNCCTVCSSALGMGGADGRAGARGGAQGVGVVAGGVVDPWEYNGAHLSHLIPTSSVHNTGPIATHRNPRIPCHPDAHSESRLRDSNQNVGHKIKKRKIRSSLGCKESRHALRMFVSYNTRCPSIIGGWLTQHL